jgi:hypothetical protein
VLSGWEILNNDFSLVKQLQCGLNHINRQPKAFLVCQQHKFRSECGGSGCDGGDGRGHTGLACLIARLSERAQKYGP